METLKITKGGDSIDEEKLSNASARSYERLLDEEQPRRLMSRKGSARAMEEQDDGIEADSQLGILDNIVNQSLEKKGPNRLDIKSIQAPNVDTLQND